VVDIPQLMQQVERLPNVALATDFMFTCSAETQPRLMELMQKHELNRVVVAACSPKTHEPLFQSESATGLWWRPPALSPINRMNIFTERIQGS
jgi:heterodisulfide reductase subunit A2